MEHDCIISMLKMKFFTIFIGYSETHILDVIFRNVLLVQIIEYFVNIAMLSHHADHS